MHRLLLFLYLSNWCTIIQAKKIIYISHFNLLICCRFFFIYGVILFFFSRWRREITKVNIFNILLLRNNYLLDRSLNFTLEVIKITKTIIYRLFLLFILNFYFFFWKINSVGLGLFSLGVFFNNCLNRSLIEVTKTIIWRFFTLSTLRFNIYFHLIVSFLSKSLHICSSISFIVLWYNRFFFCRWNYWIKSITY